MDRSRGLGQFQLFVNGQPIANLCSVKTYEAGIYDIKERLRRNQCDRRLVARTSYPDAAQLRVCGQIAEPGGNVTQILSDETWRVNQQDRDYRGFGGLELDPPFEDRRLGPPHDVRPLNDEHMPDPLGRHQPPSLTATSSRILDHGGERPTSGGFLDDLNAEGQSRKLGSRSASSGDLDLAVNGHIITLASTTARAARNCRIWPRRKRLLRLDQRWDKAKRRTRNQRKVSGLTLHESLRSPLTILVIGSNADPTSLSRPSAAIRPGKLCSPLVSSPGGTEFERFSLIEGWGRRSAGRMRAEPGNMPSRSVKTERLPGVISRKKLARPIDRSGFPTLFQFWLIIGLTLGAVVALWLIVSVIVSGWRREPLALAMCQDALLHGPVFAGLFFWCSPTTILVFQTNGLSSRNSSSVPLRLLRNSLAASSAPDSWAPTVDPLRDLNA